MIFGRATTPPSPPSTPGPAKPSAARMRAGFSDTLINFPLVYGGEQIIKGATARKGTMGDIRQWMAAGELEIALIPVADFLQQPRLSLVPCSCVNTYGAANILMLYSKTFPGEIQRILVDAESYGAENLANILLPRQVMIRPELVKSEISLDPRVFNFERDPHDAFLLTGENALLARRDQFAWVLDLSSAWSSFSDLPFIISVWCVNRGLDMKTVDRELGDIARRNSSAPAVLAGVQSQRLGIPAKNLEIIFTHALRTEFGAPEINGLRRYAKELSASGLLPGQFQLTIYRPTGTRASI